VRILIFREELSPLYSGERNLIRWVTRWRVLYLHIRRVYIWRLHSS